MDTRHLWSILKFRHGGTRGIEARTMTGVCCCRTRVNGVDVATQAEEVRHIFRAEGLLHFEGMPAMHISEVITTWRLPEAS